ncbi:MAG: rRNA maturation RNase YbeY [bacterium]|nr:rRNA maturation RNase YbeY [bacterium]
MVNVLIKSGQYGINEKRIAAMAEKTAGKNKNLSVLFCGDGKMRGLNRQYRHLDKTTDVLSFGKEENVKEQGGWLEEESYLGDIVISYPQAKRNAKKYGLEVDEEIDKLVEHGVWHLLGRHHDGE